MLVSAEDIWGLFGETEVWFDLVLDSIVGNTQSIYTPGDLVT